MSWAGHQLGKPYRLTGVVLLAALLALAALLGVSWAAGFGRVRQLLLHPHWFWLAVAVAGEFVAYLGYTFAYREIARVEHGAELGVPRAAALVTTGFGVFVQGGGFALDRWALQRAGLSRREARARVLGLGALEYAVLAPATALAALLILLRHEPVDSGLTLPWVVGVPAGAVLTLAALRYERALTAAGRRGHVAASLRALRLLVSMLRRLRWHGLALVGIGLYWLGDVFCLWATLHAFYAHTPPIAQLLVGYATGYALTRRTLPLGGAGIVEALLPFALSWVGIALAPAVLAVAAYRIINLWLPMVPALAGLPSVRRLDGLRRPRRR